MMFFQVEKMSFFQQFVRKSKSATKLNKLNHGKYYFVSHREDINGIFKSTLDD
jgi:hypothetical protein